MAWGAEARQRADGGKFTGKTETQIRKSVDTKNRFNCFLLSIAMRWLETPITPRPNGEASFAPLMERTVRNVDVPFRNKS